MGSIEAARENWKHESNLIGEATLSPQDEKPCFVCKEATELKTAVFDAALKNLQALNAGGKIVLITDPNCLPCDEARDLLKGHIGTGEIEVLDYRTCPDCDKVAIAERGIYAVPVLAARNAEGKIMKHFPLAPDNRLVPVAKRGTAIDVEAEAEAGVILDGEGITEEFNGEE